MNAGNENPDYSVYAASTGNAEGAVHNGIEESYTYFDPQGSNDGEDYYFTKHPMQQQQQDTRYNTYQQQQQNDFGVPQSRKWGNRSATNRGDYFYSSKQPEKNTQ